MPQRLKRVVVYMPEGQHRQLKAKLAHKGLDVSKWFRQMVDKLLSE